MRDFAQAGARLRPLTRPDAAYRIFLTRRSRNVRCPGNKRARAAAIENQSPRSISGASICRPERGGHSIVNVLLLSFRGSQSPSNAHAVMIFPLGCFNSPSSMNSPTGTKPVSSSNSRFAASKGGSSSRYRPFGIVQAPGSFLAHNGPPGCTRNASNSESLRRYIKRPALRFGISRSRPSRTFQLTGPEPGFYNLRQITNAVGDLAQVFR